MISFQDLLYLHERSIEDFGGAQGIRDKIALESALKRPFTSFGGEELYPTPYLKAAAILESIVKDHPFVDGNKRTGFLACIAMLRLYELKFTMDNTVAYDFVIRVASSHLALEDISTFIEQNTTNN